MHADTSRAVCLHGGAERRKTARGTSQDFEGLLMRSGPFFFFTFGLFWCPIVAPPQEREVSGFSGGAEGQRGAQHAEAHAKTAAGGVILWFHVPEH